MKLAVTAGGRELDSPVDIRFGRAGGFLVVGTETGKVEYLDNAEASGAGQGARHPGGEADGGARRPGGRDWPLRPQRLSGSPGSQDLSLHRPDWREHPRGNRAIQESGGSAAWRSGEMRINEIAKEITKIRFDHGFTTSKDNMLEKLMLVVTECSEAAEDVRDGNWNHFAEDIADAMIRLMDIGNSLGYDLEGEIRRKMEINKTRPYLHGRVNTA
jgi:NTP pyrophosphatase (non-canonical NTP hydrolase)